ncbi:MAG TPA: lipoyl(octanoyl) transferase LipB [bacterium]|nr:lipoyl(octanoyl) transferase LipB [bacterium]
MPKIPSIQFESLGRRPFAEVLEMQLKLRRRRQAGEIGDRVLFVEHPRVITRGRRPAEEDFKISPAELQGRGFEVADAGRGGRLTYHGPGQLVAYFIVSLTMRKLSIPQFVRRVEESVIGSLGEFGIAAATREGCPGVWVGGSKIASVGFSVDRGVSMHGVAVNVDPRLEDFGVIVPCGIQDCEITSMRQLLGRAPILVEVEELLRKKIAEKFDSPSPLVGEGGFDGVETG